MTIFLCAATAQVHDRPERPDRYVLGDARTEKLSTEITRLPQRGTLKRTMPFQNPC